MNVKLSVLQKNSNGANILYKFNYIYFMYMYETNTLKGPENLITSGLNVHLTPKLKKKNSAEHEIFSANKYENANIVGIFIVINRENLMLSYV